MTNIFFRIYPPKSTLLLYNPLLNVSRLVTEVHANLEQLPAVLLERLCIAFLVNLRHGLLGGTVQLEFHHIDETVRLQHQVNASVRGVTFCIDIETQELVNDEKHILIMKFLSLIHI